MQHIQTSALNFEGHNSVWRTVKYLSLAFAGLTVIVEHRPGLLIVLAIACAMVFALNERIRKLQGGSSVNPQASASRLLGDGGCFPGAEPEQEQQATGAPSVIDGGSL